MNTKLFKHYTPVLCDPDDPRHFAIALNKIHTLTELGRFLTHSGKRLPKEKVTLIYNLLLRCKDRNEMNTLTHDLTFGKETVEEFLMRKAEEVKVIIDEGIIELPTREEEA